MLEKAIISGVTHSLEESVYRVDGAAPLTALRGAFRCGAERRHHPPDRARRSSFPGRISDAADTSAALDRLGVSWSSRDDLGAGQRHRRGDEDASGCRRQDVRDARGTRNRARDREHLARSRSPASSTASASRTRCARSTAPSSSTPSRGRPCPRHEARIGVVGATGVVGTVALELLAERGFSDVPRVRVLPVGRLARCGSAAVRCASRRRRRSGSPLTSSTSASSRSGRARARSSCRRPPTPARPASTSPMRSGSPTASRSSSPA